MKGRDFLIVADELTRGATSAHWRTAVSRAYYALMLEGREALRRWGFVVKGRDQVHFFVRARLSGSSDPDLKAVGYTLDTWIQARNFADYDLLTPRFRNSAQAVLAVDEIKVALAQLDIVLADPIRCAAAIADIKLKWP